MMVGSIYHCDSHDARIRNVDCSNHVSPIRFGFKLNLEVRDVKPIEIIQSCEN